MFKRLTLTNFRKHESFTVDFSQGLIVIRGLNEAGKTTIHEAVAYALVGTSALRQPFSEVVTWGKAESSLCVKLEMSNGLTITRKKSGAEILATPFAVVPLCTGQTQCTRYMENLLGASADTAAKLMIASQGALRGALEGGPAEAAQLIENLADFDLIDRILTLITANLPSGNTKANEANVGMLFSQLEELRTADVYDATADEAEIAKLNEKREADYAAQKELSSDLNNIDMVSARRFMGDLIMLEASHKQLAPLIVVAAQAAERVVEVPTATADSITAWRRAIMDLKVDSARQQAYKTLQALPVPEDYWEGSLASLEEYIGTFEVSIYEAEKKRTEAALARQAAIGRKITEQMCAFCGKDLTDVPEVVRRNTLASADVLAAEALHTQANAAWATAREELVQLKAFAKRAAVNEAALVHHNGLITLDKSTYPSTWTWNGDVPIDNAEQPDYNRLIKDAESALAAYHRALGAVEAARAQLGSLQADEAALATTLAAAQARQPAEAERIKQGEALEVRVHQLTRQIDETGNQLQQLNNALTYNKKLAALSATRKTAAEEQFIAASKTLEQMNFNNALLKKVRGARGPISDKLWSIVLTSVSQQFSAIRGTQSIISRSDNGFLCDGQAVKGLSGSTLDALGLAIRIALTKTFLPNSRFMLLDEPGSACDEERETNMLGLIAATDFDQVLLVTHSDIADAFASQIISL